MLPGQTVAKLVGLEAGSDHEMILRMFFNVLLWSLVGVFVIVANL